MNRAAKWRGKEERRENVFLPARAIRKLFRAGLHAIKVRNPECRDILKGRGASKSLSLVKYLQSRLCYTLLVLIQQGSFGNWSWKK